NNPQVLAGHATSRYGWPAAPRHFSGKLLDMQPHAVPGSTPDTALAGQATAWNQLLQALDMEALWQACVALLTSHLPCHSCTLMYEISGYQPQRSLHYLGNSEGLANPPLLSL